MHSMVLGKTSQGCEGWIAPEVQELEAPRSLSESNKRGAKSGSWLQAVQEQTAHIHMVVKQKCLQLLWQRPPVSAQSFPSWVMSSPKQAS